MAAINKRKLLESAQKNLQKGALDKALKDYQELLAADPRDANVRLKVGDLQLKRGNADDAIAAYLKVADQFMRDGFDAKAVAIYKQVTKIDGKRFDVYIPLAELYQRIGLTNDAMAALQTAAEAYQRDGRRREALDLLRRMASLDPTNTASRLKVAELLFQEQLVDEAVAEFEEAAAELDRQGDWEARASVLGRVVEVAPQRIEAYDALIELWVGRGNGARAESAARKVLEIEPERAESLQALAGIVAERGETAAAIDLYRRAADAWIARGEDVRAREILQRHVPSEPFADAGDVPAGAISNPGLDSPFGEEGIGGEPPPSSDEFRFVDDGAPSPVPTGDVDFELELDEPSQAPVAPPARATQPTAARPAPTPAPAEAEPAVADADPEQLLAEAAVYLRYGKHERAVASLRALLAQVPDHLGALEQLGDALARGDQGAAAVETWLRGAEVARAAGDAERVSSLRTRIEAIDAAAAASLAEAEPSRAEAANTVLFEAPAPEAEAPDLEEIDVDLDDDSLDVAADAEEEGSAAASAAAPETEPAFELGSVEFEIEVDDAFAPAPPEETAAGEQVAEVAPTLEDEAPPSALEQSTALGSDAAFEDEAELPLEEIEIEVAEADAVDVPVSIEPAPDASPDAAITASEESAFLAEPFAVEHDASSLADEALAEASEAAPIGAPSDAEASDAASAFESVPPSEDAATHFDDALPAIDGDEAEPAAQAAAVAEPAPVVAQAEPAAELSTTSSRQITEDLEEAGFYFEQGLFDEAESIYRRIVARAPNHPGALLRLGEIAAARGEDPAAADDPARLEEAANEFLAVTSGAEGDESDVASTIEPPDDLDLTAREFGPEPAWEDEADETNEASEAAAPAPVDTTMDHTDPAEWTTPEPSVAEGAALEEPEQEAADAEAEPTPLALEDEPAQAPEPPRAIEEPVATPELTAPEIAADPDEGAPAFDLAAELSEALRDEPAEGARRPATDEDGFASLFSEFKRGVSRTLGEGDVETHFDLGIAYREMGLLDDAIGEFRYALGASTRRLDALHMMGLCALDLGRAADAVGHLEQALASPDVPHERETALRFDLGRAYEAQADRGRAIDAFERVVELDAAFQDAAQRLEALRASEDAPLPEPTEEASEAYESFDDLIAQTAESAEPVASETYESFDEFQTEDADEAAVSEAEPSECVAESSAPIGAESADADAVDEAAAASETEAVVEGEVEPAPQLGAESEAEPPAAPAVEPEPPRKRRKLSFF